MKRSQPVPLPKELFAEKLEQFTNPSARALEKGELRVRKDVIRQILGGDLERKEESYLLLADRLGLERHLVQACLYWHRLPEQSRALLMQMLRAAQPESGTCRERLDETIRWCTGSNVPVDSWPGCILSKGDVTKGSVPILFIFLDELKKPSEVPAFAAKYRRELELVHSIVVVLPNDTPPGPRREFEKTLECFLDFLKTEHLPMANVSHGQKQIVLTDEATLTDWIFSERFNPAVYLSRRRKDEDLIRHGMSNYWAEITVTPAGGRSSPALPYVQRWCLDSNHPQTLLVIEGGYGMGKSTLLKLLEYGLLNAICFQKRDSSAIEFIPIVAEATKWLRFAERSQEKHPLFRWLMENVFAKGNSFGSIAVDPNLPFGVFGELCRGRRRFVLIVDGLDEVVRNTSTLELAIKELTDFAQLGNHVILATRPEVFVDQFEVDRFLSSPYILRATVDSLSEKEIQKFINNYLGSPEDRPRIALVNKIRHLDYAKGIFNRPLFLNYCCRQAAERLKKLESIVSKGEPYELLEFFTDEWLDREVLRSLGGWNNVLVTFFQEMAIELSARGATELSDEQMPHAIKASLQRVLPVIQGQLSIANDLRPDEGVQREARVCSFVTVFDRPTGERAYGFSLRPFGSFFLAEAVVQDLRQNDLPVASLRLGQMRLKHEDVRFIASGLRCKLPDRQLLKEHLKSIILQTSNSSYSRLWPFAYLGGNAASIYAALNDDVLDLDLTGVSLAGLYLDGATVVGTWNGVDISDSIISNCKLDRLAATNVYASHAKITSISDRWPTEEIAKGPCPDGLVELPSGQVTTRWAELNRLDDFCIIPPGKFAFGIRHKQPGLDVFMHCYFLKRTEVTNAEFLQFLSRESSWAPANARQVLAEVEKLEGDIGSTAHYLRGLQTGLADEPVVYLPRLAMKAYCLSIGTRLPSESEWEYAYSVGLDSDESPPTNSSPHLQMVTYTEELGNGLKGMSGNAREMCADCYWPDLSEAMKILWDAVTHPVFRPMHVDSKTKGGPVHPKYATVRGHSYAQRRGHPVFSRDKYALGNMDEDVGFRPVMDIAPALTIIFGLKASVRETGEKEHEAA